MLEALDGIAKHNTEAEVNGDESSRISIVSMSLGGSFGASDDPENVAVDNLTADNVLSVIAAGNDGDITDIMGAPGTRQERADRGREPVRQGAAGRRRGDPPAGLAQGPGPSPASTP